MHNQIFMFDIILKILIFGESVADIANINILNIQAFVMHVTVIYD